MNTYLYSRQSEPLKRALHHAIYFDDYAPAAALGLDLSPLERLDSEQARYQCASAIQRWNTKDETDGIGLWKKERGITDGAVEKAQEEVENYKCFRPGLQSHEALQRLQRLRSIARQFNVQQSASTPTDPHARHLSFSRRSVNTTAHIASDEEPAHSLTMSVGDYAAVEIPTDSVIYCDIPYNSTKRYPINKRDGCPFDHSRFYDWAEAQREPVFISSYSMPPERFDCIAEWERGEKMNSNGQQSVTERLFVPKGQRERGIIDKGWLF